MTRPCTILLASLVMFGCDEASEAEVSDFDGLADGALGKSDGNAIEAALGESLDLSVVRKPAGAEATTDHAKTVVFEVPLGDAFAVVMRDRSEGQMHPWLQLRDADGIITTAQWGQGVVWDATDDDAVVFYRARETTRFVAIAADRELSVDAAFQLDIVPLVSVPVDASEATPAMQAFLGGVRRQDAGIGARDTVVEDGSGHLEWTDDTPLGDRGSIDGTNAARDDYFEDLAERSGVSEDALREAIGGLWATLSLPPYRR